MRFFARLAGVAAALASAVAMQPPSSALAADGAAIVVGSKIDTEGALLGEMIAAVLEGRGVPVERRLQLGPTNIVRAALLAGQIDIYPEYTGNGALFSIARTTRPGPTPSAAMPKSQRSTRRTTGWSGLPRRRPTTPG